MSEELRITFAIIAAVLGAVIGMGLGFVVEGLPGGVRGPELALGIRMALAGGLALFMLRQTWRETA